MRTLKSAPIIIIIKGRKTYMGSVSHSVRLIPKNPVCLICMDYNDPNLGAVGV